MYCNPFFWDVATITIVTLFLALTSFSGSKVTLIWTAQIWLLSLESIGCSTDVTRICSTNKPESLYQEIPEPSNKDVNVKQPTIELGPTNVTNLKVQFEGKDKQNSEDNMCWYTYIYWGYNNKLQLEFISTYARWKSCVPIQIQESPNVWTLFLYLSLAMLTLVLPFFASLTSLDLVGWMLQHASEVKHWTDVVSISIVYWLVLWSQLKHIVCFPLFHASCPKSQEDWQFLHLYPNNHKRSGSNRHQRLQRLTKQGMRNLFSA